MSSNVIRHSLDNGVIILVDPVPYARSVSCAFSCRGGSRDEKDSEAGITHLLEHLLFKRTKSRDTRELSELIDALGGEINAATDSESMSLIAQVPTNDLPATIDLLGELLVAPAFTQADLELEQEVIRQEIIEAQDDPDEIVYEIFAERFWAGSSLMRPTFGSVSSVAALSHEAVKRRLSEIVVGSRLIVSVAGAADPDVVIRQVGDIFGGLPRGELAVCDLPDTEPGRYMQSFPVHQIHFCLGLPWVGLKDERYLTGALCSALLGGSVSSRLFQLVREERGLAYDIHSALDAYSNCGGLLISGATEARHVNETVAIVLRELAKLRSLGVKESELDRARNMMISQLTMDCDGIGARMWRALESEAVYGRYVSADELIERVRGISSSICNDFLTHFLEKPQAVFAITGDVEDLRFESSIEAFCEDGKLDSLL